MKSIITFTLILFTNYIFSQEISTLRMGEIRLGMSLSELSQLVGTTIKLQEDKEGYSDKTANINIKGINYTLSFYYRNGESFVIQNITIYDSRIKTLSKIGVGNTLDDLINAYKNHTISIYPMWISEDNKYSTTERIFTLEDYQAGTILIFNLNNNIITSISLTYNDGC